jgi:hypothetical protein
MPAMSSELYDALLAAGAPEDKARAAAVAVANYDRRFTDLRLAFGELGRGFDTRFGELEQRFDTRFTGLEREFESRFTELRRDGDNRQFADVRSTLRLHTWVLNIIVGIAIAILFKVFSG